MNVNKYVNACIKLSAKVVHHQSQNVSLLQVSSCT